MRWFKRLPLVTILSLSVGQTDLNAPACATRCWENTKYVSKCLDNHACLCSESEYQTSVYQCLYSQCETALLSRALHHAISQCLGTENQVYFGAPPVPDREALRRREEEYLAQGKACGSGSDFGYPTRSVDYATQSAGDPIQSARYPTESVSYFPNDASTPLYFPLNTATSPVTIAASLTESAPQVLSTLNLATQAEVFTGWASGLKAAIHFSMLVAGATCFTLS